MKAEFERARGAIDFLERHRIAPTPPHYDLALHHITHPGSDLARDIDARTDGGLRLTAEDAAALIARHLAPGREADGGQRERTIARQADELGSLTSDAYEITRALESDVGSAVRQADGLPPAMGDLVARLSDAEHDLADLRREFASLRGEIGADRPRADADLDELTKALTQSGAARVLAQVAAHDRAYAIIMFGIDDLVGINRRFGNMVGDNVLNAFAATLRQVFPEGELIRWTGNEFVVVLRDMVLTAIRLLVADALAALSARRLKLRGTGEWIGVVTACAGIVLDQGDDVDGLLERARANLLAAAAGGNRAQG